MRTLVITVPDPRLANQSEQFKADLEAATGCRVVFVLGASHVQLVDDDRQPVQKREARRGATQQT